MAERMKIVDDESKAKSLVGGSNKRPRVPGKESRQPHTVKLETTFLPAGKVGKL
ncbi:hypothetical protein COLO4_35146 [Corchorus olitorius]|uniref:Uncharacterized protein n=1 Tax=Corchorus olitorius TaxID=93759 RepID=A0A1R3GI63_9ROSI|nr:hypothetical protein COLO4_35146 [Corchorus olitorius]